ncbi:hypothetical protein IG631_09728 [Alternaria alternata]|nr:hypothetical protein IG631_09728 [Alternaria alternata]
MQSILHSLSIRSPNSKRSFALPAAWPTIPSESTCSSATLPSYQADIGSDQKCVLGRAGMVLIIRGSYKKVGAGYVWSTKTFRANISSSSLHDHQTFNINMKYLTTISAALSLILSTTAAATPGPLINADLLPRDMSAMPRGITSLLTRDAMIDRRALEKRAGCFQACNSGCGGCTSMGCLSGCQINW